MCAMQLYRSDNGSFDRQKLKYMLLLITVLFCTEYDLNGYLGLTEKASSPEQVIETGRGVCCGFSSVCLQLCK